MPPEPEQNDLDKCIQCNGKTQCEQKQQQTRMFSSVNMNVWVTDA